MMIGHSVSILSAFTEKWAGPDVRSLFSSACQKMRTVSCSDIKQIENRLLSEAEIVLLTRENENLEILTLKLKREVYMPLCSYYTYPIRTVYCLARMVYNTVIIYFVKSWGYNAASWNY